MADGEVGIVNSPDRSAFRTRLSRYSYMNSSSGHQPRNPSTKTSHEVKSEPKTGKAAATEDDDDDKENISSTEFGNKSPSSPPLKPLTTKTKATKPRKTIKSSPSAKSPISKRKSQNPTTPPSNPRSKSRSKAKPKPSPNSAHLYSHLPNNLSDSLRPGITLLMIGVNPGLETARTGHAYAHPSNRYWPTMHESGITPIRHKPSETRDLVELYGLGHTNIVAYPTRTESEISKADYLEGARVLDLKVREIKPQAVAIVGKGIWEVWVQYKTGLKMGSVKGRKELGEKGLPMKFDYGWQDPRLWLGQDDGAGDDDRVKREDEGDDDDAEGNDVENDEGWKGARTFVCTTTSGAATNFSKNGGEERTKIWKPLGDWFAPKREEWVRQKTELKEE